MGNVIIVIVLLAAVLASGALSRLIPWAVPLPLLQIGLGFVIAGFLDDGIVLDPDLFFLLFLPPLLYLDGWRIPKDALKRDGLAIVQLAVGLVVVTVVGMGFIIHWMIPAMPLAVAFALAAIVSPTDAVAVEGITRHLRVPRRIVSILQGEALFNDASGLVAFRFAVAAAVTGAFSISSASLSFLWVAAAGLAIGFVLTHGLVLARRRFTARYGEERGSEILFSLLVPFAAYLLAEAVNASGILAAVAAGVTMSRAELAGKTSAATRTERRAVWNMIQFTLNGVMFVLLGEQFPGIFEGAMRVSREIGQNEPWLLPCYALVICLLLGVFRFVCIWLSIAVSRLVRRTQAPDASRASLRAVLILSVGGVRGAVTLAGVLTLPLTIAGGAAFPARDLAIFLAAGVIVFSLLIATVCLPPLLEGFDVPDSIHHDRQHGIAMHAAREAASQQLESISDLFASPEEGIDRDALSTESKRILLEIRDTLGGPVKVDNDLPDGVPRRHSMEMRQAALAASRTAIYGLARDGQISDALARDLVRRIDLEDLRLS
ncbi:Na+/H+ antiporter [Variovorax sp. J22P168]|uniref:Na+/H+ antiporter n=1 Tax=Variovorax jilinensis TaxID=3053513 RepID=UPI0025771D16|nr:Na+/H+ antiporter [Variovorax sp. J22P168]MDM0014973.1 Na+/H+ antiporter [Variovorax sp. J22P168]